MAGGRSGPEDFPVLHIRLPLQPEMLHGPDPAGSPGHEDSVDGMRDFLPWVAAPYVLPSACLFGICSGDRTWLCMEKGLICMDASSVRIFFFP